MFRGVLKWSDTDTEHLIDEVHRYKCLYDETCPESKRRIHRVTAWQEISNVFPNKKLTMNECVRKWTALRRSYINLQSRFLKTGIKPKWIHFKRMHFIIIAQKRSNKRFRLELIAAVRYVSTICH